MSRLQDSAPDRTARAAARTPKALIVGAELGGSGDDAVLAMARPRRTAEIEALEAAERHKAAQTVADFTMLRAHGCAGRGCVSEAHAADRETRDRVLAMLGLEAA